MNTKLIGIVVAAFAIGAGAAYMASMQFFDRSVKATRSTGRALIGGPFTMVSHQGAAFTEKDLLGQYSLVFFGFTYCPDVCPATLQVASEAMEKLGPLAKNVSPIFVSVDPERDTPAVLKSYLEDFDPRVIGLTGSATQVKAMTKAYRIYANKVNDPNSEGGYTMDHSAYMYLMSPEGTYVTHYPPAIQADALAEKLRPVLSRS